VLAGTAETTQELAALLPSELEKRVVDTMRMPIDAPTGRVVQETLVVAERAQREAERRRLAELFERGRLGLSETLAVLQEGRAQTLVYAEGFESDGGECLRCHALFAPERDSVCRYCGERLVQLDDLVARAVERARDAGARIEQVRGDAAARLADAGSIGAVLRY
jgi:peptide subunit release factor 1 (eRF1)